MQLVAGRIHIVLYLNSTIAPCFSWRFRSIAFPNMYFYFMNLSHLIDSIVIAFAFSTKMIMYIKEG